MKTIPLGQSFRRRFEGLKQSTGNDVNPIPLCFQRVSSISFSISIGRERSIRRRGRSEKRILRLLRRSIIIIIILVDKWKEAA